MFQFLSFCFCWRKRRFNFILSEANSQLVIDKPVTYNTKLSVLCSFGLGPYVDIASMYRMHKETVYDLRHITEI